MYGAGIEVLILLLIWAIPLIGIALSKRTAGAEKAAWILAVLFISWLAWLIYLLLAPLKPSPPRYGP